MVRVLWSLQRSTVSVLMTRAGAMNLLSSRLRRIMPDKKELSIVTFSSETVVFDGKGDRVVACPTEQEAVEYIRGQEIPVDRQGSEYYE